MRPTINLDAGISQGLDQDVRRDSLTMSFNQTLYSGGALSSGHRQALANKEAAEANLLQTNAWVWADTQNMDRMLKFMFQGVPTNLDAIHA